MSKLKKLFLVILFILFVSDICKYLKLFASDQPIDIVSFDFVLTRYTCATIVNKASIFLFTVSLFYFLAHFLKNDNK